MKVVQGRLRSRKIISCYLGKNCFSDHYLLRNQTILSWRWVGLSGYTDFAGLDFASWTLETEESARVHRYKREFTFSTYFRWASGFRKNMASSYDAFPALPPASMSRVPPGNLIGTDGYAPEMHHSNEVVQLNVGGTIYSTLYDTLVNSKSKFFEHMLRVDPQSGRVVVFKQNVIVSIVSHCFIKLYLIKLCRVLPLNELFSLKEALKLGWVDRSWKLHLSG